MTLTLGWMKGWAAATVLLCMTSTVWGQAFVYPQRGQSPEQQQRDQGECHVWAVQQSGFNPGAPVASAPPQGGAVRGAARGAAIGAVGGAIGGDAGKGAAIGAGTGALFGSMRRADQVRQQQALEAQGQGLYNRAVATCLGGRGYTVG
jgi:hypothetical protein